MRATFLSLGLLAIALAGCDSRYEYPDSGPGVDSGPRDSGPPRDAAGQVTLTLLNYFAWCTVTVNDVAVADVASQPLMFDRGTVVPLMATPDAPFMWGYWVGTIGDTTPSHDINTDTSVLMDGDKTVQACCPDSSGVCPAP